MALGIGPNAEQRAQIDAEVAAYEAKKRAEAEAAAARPTDEAAAIMDAQDSGRVVTGLGDANRIDMGVEGLSPGQALPGDVAPAAVGPRAELQREGSLAERMAPGRQAQIDAGLAGQAEHVLNRGDIESEEASQLASWYSDQRREQDKLLSKSMSDYADRRAKIDEFTPKLLEAAERIRNISEGKGTFWGGFKEAMATQAAIAMHLVSDDHVGVQRLVGETIDRSMNKERMKLEQARTAYDAMQSTLGQYRALAGDAQIGDQLYRKSALEVAAMKLEEIASTFKSKTSKENAAIAYNKIMQDAGMIGMQIGEQTFRQASMQTPALARYNNQMQDQAQRAELAKVGAGLMKLAGGDPVKAERIGVAANINPVKVKAALAAVSAPAQTPSASPTASAPPSKPAAAAAVASVASKVDPGKKLTPEEANAELHKPEAWARMPKPDEAYNKLYLDLERAGEIPRAAEIAYTVGEGKLLSKGRGAEASKYRAACRDAVAAAMVGAEEKLDQYVAAAALKGNYSVWDRVFAEQAKATGKDKQDVANAWLQAGREGFFGSAAEYVAKALSVDPDRLRGPLKSMGIADDRQVASQVFLSYVEAMKMANAHKLFGVISDKDKGTAAELFNGKYSRWSDLGGAIAKADADGRSAINSVADRAKIPGDYGVLTTGAMKKAMVRGEVYSRIDALKSGMFKAQRGR